MSAGRIVLDVEPTQRNPRNSEGAFITLGDGRILFAWSRFTGRSDNSPAVIASIVSADAGRTWTPRKRTLVPNEGERNVMSVSFLRLADGRIALFYAVKNGWHDCRLRMRTSKEEGKTWSRPRLTIPAPGYFVVNNDRVVQLSTGRLIVPAAYHRRKTDSNDAWASFDGRGIAMYFLSDDGGRTWREAKTWRALPAASGSGLQEPGVVELADGKLFSWCRTDLGCQYGMCSTDGGESWSLPAPTGFLSPCSPLSMKRIPSTGDLLAVWNDHSGRFGMPRDPKGKLVRNPLVSAISTDEGNTWRHHRPIEIDPDGRFCYIALHFCPDEHVLLAYSAGGKPPKTPWGALRVRRITTEWLYSS